MCDKRQNGRKEKRRCTNVSVARGIKTDRWSVTWACIPAAEETVAECTSADDVRLLFVDDGTAKSNKVTLMRCPG